jgi:predicted Zn finger-like uncharacterized protein
MIITCGNCQTSFKVSPDQIKETGSRVRCSNCQSVFTVFKPRIQTVLGANGENLPQKDSSNPLAPPIDNKNDDSLDKELNDLMAQSRSQNPPNLSKTESNNPPSKSLPRIPAKQPFPAESAPLQLVDGLTPDSPEWEETDETNDHGNNDLGLYDDPITSDRTTTTPKLELAPKEKPPKPPRTKKRKIILLIMTIILAFLGIGLVILSILPGDTGQALQIYATAGAGATVNQDNQNTNPQNVIEQDPNQTLHLTFPANQLVHHYRVNKNAGHILIITGRIANGYPDRRSFLRLKALLKDDTGVVVAERQSYAGNILSEEELINLPIQEIQARLNLKGGLNGINQNIPSGKDLPFMLVFDKLPTDLSEYIVEPVSSTSSSQQLNTVQNP